MTKPRAALQFYKDQAGEWRWRVYSANGEIVSTASEGYVRRIDAEHGAALTMIGITEAALQAVQTAKTDDRLIRMRPVVQGIMEASGLALEAIREMGLYNERGLTSKGRKLIESNIREELKREKADLELSKAMPAMKTSLQIPVQYTDKPVEITVRVK